MFSILTQSSDLFEFLIIIIVLLLIRWRCWPVQKFLHRYVIVNDSEIKVVSSGDSTVCLEFKNVLPGI